MEKVSELLWAKVSYGQIVKRIYKPSIDMPTFIEQIRIHFASDSLGEFDVGVLESEMTGQKLGFCLLWFQMSAIDQSSLDSSKNAIQVLDQDHFAEIMFSHAIMADETSRVPRFAIQKWPRNSLKHSDPHTSNDVRRAEEMVNSVFGADQGQSFDDGLIEMSEEEDIAVSVENLMAAEQQLVAQLSDQTLYSEANKGTWQPAAIAVFKAEVPTKADIKNVCEPNHLFKAAMDSDSDQDLESLHVEVIKKNVRKQLKKIGPKIFRELMEEISSKKNCQTQTNWPTQSTSDQNMQTELVSEQSIDQQEQISEEISRDVQLACEQQNLESADARQDYDLEQLAREESKLGQLSLKGCLLFGDKIVDHQEIDVELPNQENMRLTQIDLLSVVVKANLEQVHTKLTDSNVFKRAFRNLFREMTPETVPTVDLAKNQDPEVYCELKKAEQQTVDVTWRLRNPKGLAWPAGMELIPLMSAPTVRILFDSKIQIVAAESDCILNLSINVPSDFAAQHLVIYFKIRSNKNVFIGPNLVLCVNILDQAEGLTDEQCLSMGSTLMDEGFGSFERCCLVIRTVKGDMQEAKSVLSKLMIADCQFQ